MKPLTTWLRQVDDLLRARDRDSLDPARESLHGSVKQLAAAAAVLGAAYGFFVGWYMVRTRGWEGLLQILAAAAKIPLLFLLTLAVTFPSLYVFSALMDSRLSFHQTLRLLLTAIVVTLAAAAAFGPILGFFTVSTESYPFIVLLNVALLGVAGFIGMGYLLRTLRRVLERHSASAPTVVGPAADQQQASAPTPAQTPPAPPPVAEDPNQTPESRLRARESITNRPPPVSYAPRPSTGLGIFYIWVVIYGLVGAQMAWILRPFIGSPTSPFELFRDQGGNFFQAVLIKIGDLLGLGG